MILIVDNYDSFVHNLARYIRQLCLQTDQQICVIRNNDTMLQTLDRNDVDVIVLSPGPCGPDEAGQSLRLIEKWHKTIPILGVCLGHQAIVQSFGGTIAQSKQPMHGKQSPVYHDEIEPLFQNIPSPFQAGRYHSLLADNDSLPESLYAIAKTENDTIMAVKHNKYPTYGVQFHPESVLTEFGYQLLFNFLCIAKIECRLPENTQVIQ